MSPLPFSLCSSYNATVCRKSAKWGIWTGEAKAVTGQTVSAALFLRSCVSRQEAAAAAPPLSVQKSGKAYSTWYSQAVSHPSTNQARPCLASEIGRDRACSGWYGRKQLQQPPMPALYVSLLTVADARVESSAGLCALRALTGLDSAFVLFKRTWLLQSPIGARESAGQRPWLDPGEGERAENSRGELSLEVTTELLQRRCGVEELAL